jgi:hypothetical protein
MWLIIGLLVAVTVVSLVRRARAPADAHAANLGWMSEQWLAEHRASHLS